MTWKLWMPVEFQIYSACSKGPDKWHAFFSRSIKRRHASPGVASCARICRTMNKSNFPVLVCYSRSQRMLRDCAEREIQRAHSFRDTRLSSRRHEAINPLPVRESAKRIKNTKEADTVLISVYKESSLFAHWLPGNVCSCHDNKLWFELARCAGARGEKPSSSNYLLRRNFVTTMVHYSTWPVMMPGVYRPRLRQTIVIRAYALHYLFLTLELPATECSVDATFIPHCQSSFRNKKGRQNKALKTNIIPMEVMLLREK